MKNIGFLTIIALCTCLFSCGKESVCTEITNSVAFEFQEGEVFCLDDLYEITIQNVIDDRCPCDVVCVWEGEFAFEIDIAKDGATESFRLQESIPNDNFPFDLKISNLEKVTDEDCDNPVEVKDIVFSLVVEQ